jgi:hypothetical protein
VSRRIPSFASTSRGVAPSGRSKRRDRSENP